MDTEKILNEFIELTEHIYKIHTDDWAGNTMSWQTCMEKAKELILMKYKNE